jgi:pimeloyl-ACP methyl ester carboxylesterase
MLSYTMKLLTALTVLLLSANGLVGPAFAQGEKVVVTTTDHYRITGTLTTPPKSSGGAAVVLLPIYKQTKESWQPLIPSLTEKGIASLAIDLRGNGESRRGPNGEDNSIRVDERDPTLFSEMHLDAEAAVRALIAKGLNPNRIGLVGASVGCSVALQVVAAGSVPVRAVVLMTPGKEYLGLRSMEDIRRWPAKGLPLLILSSREEAGRGALAIYQQLRTRGAELKLFDQQEIHGTAMFGKVHGVEKLISAWLAANLQAGETKTTP